MADFHALSRRSCFECAHYSLSWCSLHAEGIDSELFAAMDCPDYEVQT